MSTVYLSYLEMGRTKFFNLGSSPYQARVYYIGENMETAVAYIRVSTKSDAQLHSYDFQLEYWKRYIKNKPDQEFGGIYADYGISGRTMNNRKQLLRLLKDAREGKFKVIYVKSVSRFARNTEELLKTVRELRNLGVRVYFEKENIDTFDKTSEVFLTIAASIAENDLKICSENQKWSIRKKYEKGFISVGPKILGYKMDKETNTLIVEPSQAETVRYIYDLYMQGLGVEQLAKRLTQEGRKNALGIVKWSRGSVRYVLTNEKYIGNSIMNKTISVQGKCIKNKGQEKKYFLEKIHEPIISDELFDAVQKEMHRRGSDKLRDRVNETYPFTGMIVCGSCGKKYIHKINNIGKPYQSDIWICHTQAFEGVKTCPNLRIKDDVLKAKFIECFNEFVSVKQDNDMVLQYKQELAKWISLEDDLTALKVNRMISLDDYNVEIARIRSAIKDLNDKIASYEMRGISKEDYNPITEFDETKVQKFVDHVTILDKTVKFTFVNGVEISRGYDNGRAGNQKGWLEKKEKTNHMEDAYGNSKKSS